MPAPSTNGSGKRRNASRGTTLRRTRPRKRHARSLSPTRKLYETCLQSLRDPFLAGESPAIDEIVTFIEVDLPGIRTGYDKEYYLTKIKKLKLSERQMDRLRAVALKRCASNEYRREDGE